MQPQKQFERVIDFAYKHKAVIQYSHFKKFKRAILNTTQGIVAMRLTNGSNQRVTFTFFNGINKQSIAEIEQKF